MSYVRSANASTGAVLSDSFTLNGVGAGHCLIAAIRISDGNDRVTKVEDDKNGLWTQIANVQNAAGTIRHYVYKRENVTAGNTVITVTMSLATTVRWGAAEYTERTVEDFQGANFTSTTTPTSPAAAAADGNGTIASILSIDGNVAIDPAGGETERFEVVNRLQLQDRSAGSPGSYSGAWTVGSAQTGFAAALALKAVPDFMADVPDFKGGMQVPSGGL